MVYAYVGVTRRVGALGCLHRVAEDDVAVIVCINGRLELSIRHEPSWNIARTRGRRHEEFYVQHTIMLEMCLRMRWARDTWVRMMFQSLCEQFYVDTAVDLANF